MCKSRTLVDITNKQRQTHLGKSRSGGASSEESENLVVSSVNYARDTHRIQWHLRRRESSDRSLQPHSAPAGLAAQQSENFQRFYRAVVSPTHVRVTAGGRIVPNTRSLAPPVFEWNKDKFVFEPPRALSDNHPLAFRHAPWPQIQPVFQHPPPHVGFTTSYDHTPQNNVTPANMNSEGHNEAVEAEKHSSKDALKLNDEAPSKNDRNGAAPQSIKLSHPSHFDQSKPFMFNGHVVYPLPAGHQPPPNAVPVPFTVLGNPNFAAQHTANFAAQHAGPPVPQQLPFAFGQVGNPMMLPMMHQHALPPRHHNESLPHMAPFFHAPGIVSVSDVTKNQIQNFYTHLKYLDGQIATDQINDGNYMVHQRNQVVAAIAKMEAMLEAQLIHEGKLNTDTLLNEKLGDRQEIRQVTGSSDGADGLRDTKRSDRESSVTTEGASSGLHQAIFSKPKSVPVHISAPGEPTKQILKAEHVQTMDKAGGLKHVTRLEPAGKSKLTAAAAMAPPFQPRAQAMVASNSFANSSVELPRMEMQFPTDVQPFHARIDKTQSMQENQMHAREGSLPVHLDRSHTFPGPAAVSASSLQPIIPAHTVPYLVGVLPQGVNIHEAKSSDLVYSRPLTEEEVRARYLYWGKAPRFVQSGLPKFDGKDFYPPSPIKQMAHPMPVSSDDRVELSGLSQDWPKYHPSANNQSHTGPNLAEIGESSRHMSLEHGSVGFPSPSPQPSANRAWASGPPIPLGMFEQNTHDHAPLASMQTASFIPSAPSQEIGESKDSLVQDFSHLFLERGAPGYKSPTPPPQSASKTASADRDIPTTPANRQLASKAQNEDDDVTTGESWGASAADTQWHQEEIEIVTSIEPNMDDNVSDTSTIEINLTSKSDTEDMKTSNGTGSNDSTLDSSR